MLRGAGLGCNLELAANGRCQTDITAAQERGRCGVGGGGLFPDHAVTDDAAGRHGNVAHHGGVSGGAIEAVADDLRAERGVELAGDIVEAHGHALGRRPRDAERAAARIGNGGAGLVARVSGDEEIRCAVRAPSGRNHGTLSPMCPRLEARFKVSIRGSGAGVCPGAGQPRPNVLHGDPAAL